jgi:hypothetical protein
MLDFKQLRIHDYFISEKKFLDFFFKRLRLNETGRYVEDFPFLSPCGRERNFIRCDDRPIVYVHLTDNKEKGLKDILSYGYSGSPTLNVKFEPSKICMLPETGRIYHPADPDLGGVGLIKSSIAISISKFFDFENGEENPPTHFTWNGEKHTLNNDLLSVINLDPKEACKVLLEKET